MASLQDIVNEDDRTIELNNSDLLNWNIPKISESEVYQTSWVQSTFRTEYKVKTVERAYAISKNKEHYYLFNKKAIKSFKDKGYKFLHIGLSQVAIKPLIRIGIKAFVLLILQDARFKAFEPSLLGMVEASLYNGPIHFNCYTNLIISLDVGAIEKVLTFYFFIFFFMTEEPS